MNGTHLGTAQVLFVRVRDAVEVDLVLSGAAYVEGRALVAGSPVALSIEIPREAWARRRLVRLLRCWSDTGDACRLDVSLDEGVAVLGCTSGGETVTGPLTDLDVLFASDLPETSI